MMDQFIQALGDEVIDPEEESFLVFSQTVPSQDLGFVNSKASVLDVTVAGRDLSIQQSPTILSSNRKEGTTGAVVWKVTPRFADWIASPQNILFRCGVLDSASIILELGCGVSGIVALALAPSIGRYVATDQDYVLKLLRHNILENVPKLGTTSGKHSRRASGRKALEQDSSSSFSNIEVIPLDWETDVVSSLPGLTSSDKAQQDARKDAAKISLLIACDCIYNEALVEPFVDTCVDVCRLSTPPTLTVCIIAQQLRSADVFEAWLKAFHRSFRVWRMPDELLTEQLREGSGFVMHVGILRGLDQVGGL